MASRVESEPWPIHSGDEPLIRRTPGVCGGSARVRNTRIPVWSLIEARRLGIPDEQLRARYDPPLTQSDLDAAWDYYDSHRNEIERDLWLNQAVMVEPSDDQPAAWFLVAGHRLGLSDEEIRDAFEPPLAAARLEAAWGEYRVHAAEIDREIERRRGC